MKQDVKEIQKTLMNKADNMAAAATTFSSHGYDSFIHAREDFMITLKQLEEQEEPKNFLRPN